MDQNNKLFGKPVLTTSDDPDDTFENTIDLDPNFDDLDELGPVDNDFDETGDDLFSDFNGDLSDTKYLFKEEPIENPTVSAKPIQYSTLSSESSEKFNQPSEGNIHQSENTGKQEEDNRNLKIAIGVSIVLLIIVSLSVFFLYSSSIENVKTPDAEIVENETQEVVEPTPPTPPPQTEEPETEDTPDYDDSSTYNRPSYSQPSYSTPTYESPGYDENPEDTTIDTESDTNNTTENTDSVTDDNSDSYTEPEPEVTPTLPDENNSDLSDTTDLPSETDSTEPANGNTTIDTAPAENSVTTNSDEMIHMY